VYVATPAIWPGGWLPPLPLPSGARLEAAAVGPAQPVATASPRGYAHNNGGETVDYANTRMLRWAVPAGSVYLISFADAGEPPHAVDGGAAAGGPAQLAAGERAARWAASVHGTAIGRADCDQGARCRAHPDCRLRTAGFGVVLTGAWT
jgi:CRISPR-associated protein Cmr3